MRVSHTNRGPGVAHETRTAKQYIHSIYRVCLPEQHCINQVHHRSKPETNIKKRLARLAFIGILYYVAESVIVSEFKYQESDIDADAQLPIEDECLYIVLFNIVIIITHAQTE